MLLLKTAKPMVLVRWGLAIDLHCHRGKNSNKHINLSVTLKRNYQLLLCKQSNKRHL